MSEPSEPPSSQDIEKLNILKSELQQYLEKLSELESEKEEYQVVLNAMKGMALDRKCYRQVSGVLMQQNVGEALPYLENQLNGILTALQQLILQKENKQKELMAYQQKISSK